MSKLNKQLLYFGSFFLPFLLLVILWSQLKLAPFGNNTLLVSDLGTQYLPFLSSFKHFFQNGLGSLYSFSDALGGSTLPLVAYYLLSPFNFLVLFFSYEQLPIAILLIITLKISFMGSSMFYYLQKTYQRTSLYTLLFSTSYSFCGFVTVYALNFMWLDALLLLPLLILGIQHLWDQKKYWLYAVSLFLSIVTNYYMGYMLCIFAVCYSLYWYYRDKKTSLWQFIKDGKLFFVTSFLTGISTSFILIPAIEGMLATKKTNFDPETFSLSTKFGLSILSQLGIGSVNFALRLEHLPVIFSGLFVTLFFITSFLLPTISKKEKRNTLFLLGILFLSLWLELINTIWHMFQSPAGFPYRNTFIFSFLMVKFGYEAFLKVKNNTKLTVMAPIIFSVLLTIGLISLNHAKEADLSLSDNYFWVSLLGLWLIYTFILFIQKSQGKPKLLYSGLLILLVCLELLVNFGISLKDIPFANQDKFARTYQKQQRIISDLKDKQPELFRIKQTVNSKQAGYNEPHNGYNNPILYNYAGISSYTSTLDAKTQDTLTALGLYQKNDRRIAYVDEAKVINLLLNVAYQLTPVTKENQKNSAIDPDTALYHNQEALGMGFLTPTTFSSLKLTDDPLLNQEIILQHIQSNKTTYFQKTQPLTWNQTDKNSYTLTTKTTATGDLYLYAPKMNWKKITTLKVNGKKIEPSIYIATNQIFNLGAFKQGESVHLQFESEKQLDEQAVKLETLEQQQFDTLISSKRKQGFHLTQQTNGTLTGKIEVNDPKTSLLYLSIPYDKNWQIIVDGKRVETKRIMGNFIGIELTTGKHQLAMHYQQRSFIIGLLISLIVVAGTFIYQVYKKTKTK